LKAEKYIKPPLGLIPRQAHDYQRIQDIKEAMIRYINAHMDIPTEWLEEWGEFMRKYPNADFQLFKVKVNKIKHCNICNKEDENLNELILDGTDDIYDLDVCDKCYDLYSSDYFSPEKIDNLFNGE